MKFIVDCMLGKLAKWLKIFGFDVIYFSKVEDRDLLRLAQKESRTLLTRDTALLERAKGLKSLFIESDQWEEQLSEVLTGFDLWKNVKPYSRCVECNRRLKSLSRRNARNLVAPFVFERARSFAICPACGRVYWQGTHFEDMNGKIEDILKRGHIT